MLKSILFVLDPRSEESASLALAVNWAKEFDAMLVALGIVDPAGIVPLEPVPLGATAAKQARDAAQVDRHRAQTEARLSAIAARCAAAQVTFKPLETEGWAYEQIQREAQRFDLIMMSRRDDGTNFALDAPLVGLLRATPRPVVVPPDQIVAGKSIVVAYDGSLQAARSLLAFAATGLARLGEIHVITVGADPQEAARSGDRAIDFLSHHQILARLHAIAQTGAPAEHLLDMTQRLDAALVVMGAYGKSQVREFFLGSVTRSMLEKCRVPLFLYH